MSEIALRLKCSVEADVTPVFAWLFRTDVSNWNDPPARFALDGSFEAGSRGTTQLPGQRSKLSGATSGAKPKVRYLQKLSPGLSRCSYRNDRPRAESRNV